jgi:hypothetical protein
MFKKLILAFLLVSFATGCSGTSVMSEFVPGNDEAPIIVLENLKNKASLRIEFVLSLADKEEYPEAYAAFMGALAEWAAVTPVEFIVFVPNVEDQMAMGKLISERPGILILDFAPEIRAPDEENYLGTFSWSSRTLRLDMSDFYKKGFNPDMAKAVSLHELGHMFGLTHFYNSRSLKAKAGSFIVKEGAEFMMMAPFLPRDYASVKISQVELDRALIYIDTILPTKLNRF